MRGVETVLAVFCARLADLTTGHRSACELPRLVREGGGGRSRDGRASQPNPTWLLAGSRWESRQGLTGMRLLKEGDSEPDIRGA